MVKLILPNGQQDREFESPTYMIQRSELVQQVLLSEVRDEVLQQYPEHLNKKEMTIQ